MQASQKEGCVSGSKLGSRNTHTLPSEQKSFGFSPFGKVNIGRLVREEQSRAGSRNNTTLRSGGLSKAITEDFGYDRQDMHDKCRNHNFHEWMDSVSTLPEA